jgi:PST family polysaccharide transporter
MADSIDPEISPDLPAVEAAMDYLRASPTAQAGAPSLGQKTFHGAIWLTIASLTTKGINTLGQIALSWFLHQRDFGLISLAYTACAFLTILKQTGLRDILTQRQDHYRRWANAAFWMSAFISLITSLAMFAAAPIAAHIFKKNLGGDAPILIGLLAILAITNLLEPIGMLPYARLQIEMRFRLLAIVGMIACAFTTGFSIFLAWRRFGAYSFVLPILVIGFSTNVGVWLLIRPRIRWNLQVRRWKFLLNDTGMLVGTAFFNTSVMYGDYLMMGLFQTKDTAGLYYFAYFLSNQAVQVLASNLGGVIFSALSTANQKPQQQTALFLRVTRIMAVFAVPVCLLQAALARPLVHLVFAQSWQAAIPIIQLLSIAMAFSIISGHVWGLLKSQGRFRSMMVWAASLSILFLVPVGLSARFGGLTRFGAVNMVAGVQIAYYALLSPTAIWIFTRPSQSLGQVYWQLCAVPVFCSAVALAPGLLLVREIPWLQRHDVVQVVVMTASALVIYSAIIRWVAAEPWQEMMRLAKGLLSPRSKAPATPA